jgi:N-acetylmuramoyl-L-alanine amidase
MTRTVRRPLSWRSALVAGGAALLVALPTLPAFAATPPAAPTSPTGAVGDRFVDLSWSGGGSNGVLVRDITDLGAAPADATQGVLVSASGATARDSHFSNRRTEQYALWSVDADGTTSTSYTAYSQAVAPLVGTTLSFAVARSAAPYGQALALSGTLMRAGGFAVPNAEVDLYGRYLDTSTATLVRHLRTGSDGSVHTSLLPQRTIALGLRFAGDAFSAASTSPLLTTRITPLVNVALSPSAVLRDQVSVLTGQVNPHYAGARVVVQQRVPGAWRSIAIVRTTSAGSYRYALPNASVGSFSYRVVVPATIAWSQAVSRGVGLRVEARDLVSGLSGSDVLALKRRLAALHYDVGSYTTAFGYDLTHAVITFQKVERLPRTGRWTKVERTRATHPTAWKVRNPSAGLAVEVDITRQVLVLSRGGVVQKIVDVSTGSEKPYYQDGVRNIAHTPRGRYAITRKIDGIRVSKLGQLYRPAYWYQGYAIHGNGSVPAYPASHGCVRVTNPVMDRLFPILVKGVPVTVFDE